MDNYSLDNRHLFTISWTLLHQSMDNISPPSIKRLLRDLLRGFIGLLTQAQYKTGREEGNCAAFSILIIASNCTLLVGDSNYARS